MTGYAKTSHVHIKTEIHFIAQDHSYTQEVSMHSVSTSLDFMSNKRKKPQFHQPAPQLYQPVIQCIAARTVKVFLAR